MKKLIIEALDIAMTKLSTPETKKISKSISIVDVKPSELPAFIADNKVPSTAYFDGRDNGYDAWDDILLTWEIEVPTTDNDKLKHRKKRFGNLTSKGVHDLLKRNGYQRVGFNSGLLRNFDDTTIYDMYLVKDFDRLVKYYSLFWRKND